MAAIDVKIKEKLLEADRQIPSSELYKMWGPTLLGYPMDTDAGRLLMYTSHLKQFLIPLKPEIPKILTGFENTFGRLNKAYKKLEGKWEVKDKIVKFPNNPDSIYVLVVYNQKEDKYDMIEKKVAENLTEKFGYVYNTEVMDNLEIGEVINNSIVFKSNSYDENMNYRFGVNGKTMYTTLADTLEDAIVVRKSWAEKIKTVEIDEADISIDLNVVPLNLYGNNDVYKIIPDINTSTVDHVLCGTRKRNKKHELYNFDINAVRELRPTDNGFFVSKNGIIYDIDVYFNGEEFPQESIYSQLKMYYDFGMEYMRQLYEWSTKIKESGSKYTSNVTQIRSHVKNFDQPGYVWRYKDRIPNNIFIRLKIKSVVGLELGSKLTGRYGNKGVVSRKAGPPDVKRKVSDLTAEDYATLKTIFGETFDINEITDIQLKELNDPMTKTKLDVYNHLKDIFDADYDNIKIVDDDKMYYTDRYPVDVLLNSSGAVRRLNPAQLVETELNFIASEIQYKIQEMDNIDDKANLAFQFLSMINEDQYNFYYSQLKNDELVEIGDYKVLLYNNKFKYEFIKDIEENGFYLIKPPHIKLSFERIEELYNTFDWIKPVQVYIDLFGIKKRKVIRPAIIGDEFFITLKQNTSKSTSARSTYKVNRSQAPAKDTSKRNNRSAYSKTPIALTEIYALFPSIDGVTLAKQNLMTRSSVIGMKSLGQIMATPNHPLNIRKLKITDNMTNLNADIINAKLTAMGIGLEFGVKDEVEPLLMENVTMPLKIDKYTIYDTPLNKHKYLKIFQLYRDFLSNSYILENYRGERVDIAIEKVFEDPEVKDMNFPPNVKEMLKDAFKMDTSSSLKPLEEADEEEDLISDEHVKVEKIEQEELEDVI